MRVILLALLLAQMPQPAQTGTVTITARDAVTRAGIPGVFITLTYKFPLEPAGAATSVLTDQQGRATFNLPAGNYQMAAERQGYVLSSRLQDIFLESGQRPIREISFNPLAMIAGRVRYATGDPAALVSISALSVRYQAGQSMLTSGPIQTTDERGEFRLPVSPGEYYVKIDNSSRLNRSPHPVPRVAFHPGVPRLSEAKAISIRGESVHVGDIYLPRSQVFSISGTVVAPAGSTNAANTARIYLLPADPSDLAESIQVGTGQPTPASFSELPFKIEGINPGNYLVYASYQASARPAQTYIIEKMPLTITDRDISGVRIAVKPNLDVPVRVIISGDRSSVSLEDVFIRLQPRDRLPSRVATSSGPGAIRVDPSTGESTLTGLGNNLRFGIRVSGLYGNAYVADVRQGGQNVFADAAIEANPSAGAVEIEIRTEGGVIQGVVRDTSSQPAQATVVLIPDSARRKNLDLYKTATTNSSGQFAVRGIAPGQYQIFALPIRPEVAVDDPAFIAQHQSRMTPISVSAGSTIETSLRIIP
jgi:hypothetical protein